MIFSSYSFGCFLNHSIHTHDGYPNPLINIAYTHQSRVYLILGVFLVLFIILYNSQKEISRNDKLIIYIHNVT